MAMKQANSAQKKWMSDIAEWANSNLHVMYIGGYAQDCEFQLHHVLGRSAKHNKVAIGHWFIIPVPFELHDPNVNHEFHVGHAKKSFVKKFGDQRGIFQCLVSCMAEWGYNVPPMDVYDAIMA